MENITLGQIAVAVAFVVGLATGVAAIRKIIKSWLTDAFKAEFAEINKKLDDVNKRVKEVDMESCKTFLVSFMSRLDRGNDIDEIELERFWEQYQHYEKNGGNSYIHRKAEQLKSDGKL